MIKLNKILYNIILIYLPMDELLNKIVKKNKKKDISINQLELEIQLKIRQEENLQYKQQRELNGFEKLWCDTNYKITNNLTKFYQRKNKLINKLEYFYPPKTFTDKYVE
jgi:hypothetical protein